MLGDEPIDRGAIADQRLEREVAVQAEPIGQRDQDTDDDKRGEPPNAGGIGRRLEACRAMSVVRCADGRSPIVGRRAH